MPKRALAGGIAACYDGTMQFEFSCMQCSHDALERRATPEEHQAVAAASRVIGMLTHECAATVVCPAGHRTTYIVQGGAHALFYERALQRLAQGAPRDAVLDAFTALEIFVKTVVERCAFDAAPEPKDLAKIREHLRGPLRTSAGATAAAGAAIVIRSGAAPPTVSNNVSEIRNRATHQGEYPSEAEAEKAVLEVARVVREFESLLARSAGSDPRRYDIVAGVRLHLDQRAKDESAQRVSVGMPLVLGNLESPPPDASKRLSEYRAGAGLMPLR